MNSEPAMFPDPRSPTSSSSALPKSQGNQPTGGSCTARQRALLLVLACKFPRLWLDHETAQRDTYLSTRTYSHARTRALARRNSGHLEDPVFLFCEGFSFNSHDTRFIYQQLPPSVVPWCKQSPPSSGRSSLYWGGGGGGGGHGAACTMQKYRYIGQTSVIMWVQVEGGV